MIILDTHIWIWWVQRDVRLLPIMLDLIRQKEAAGVGVSAISCWEVANLVARGFHRDPAGQIIVATARVYDCPLVTVDQAILAHPHVQLAP